MKFVYICGLPGTGKGMLRVLIDSSNKNIITCPFQGFGYEIISDNFEIFLKRKKTIHSTSIQQNMDKGYIFIGKNILTYGEFFKLLGNSLKNLSDASYGGYIRAASNERNEQFIKFKFNYDKFVLRIKKLFENKHIFKNKFQLYEFFIQSFILLWKKRPPSYA